MAALGSAGRETKVRCAGIEVQVRRGGAGTPLLFIHGEMGAPGWIDAFEHLSQSHDVIVPSLPGYGTSERPDWIMSVNDMAAWIAWFARDSEIVMPVDVVGCSMGGWIAAEIAVVAPEFINKLVLCSPMGIKPREGDIFDYFLESGATGLHRSFHDPEGCAQYMKYYGKELSPDDHDRIEQHREMTCRIAWKPYMHSLTLPAFLPSLNAPTMILCGEQDRIVPLDAARQYAQGIAGSELVTIKDCGHMPELEQPEQFAAAVREFLKR